jgi:RecG-like helicase
MVSLEKSQQTGRQGGVLGRTQAPSPCVSEEHIPSLLNQQKESQSDFKFLRKKALSDAHKQCKRLRTRVEREEELQGVVQLALQQQQQEKKTLNPLRRKQKRTEMTGAANRLPLCGLHSTVFLPPSGHRLFSFLHN